MAVAGPLGTPLGLAQRLPGAPQDDAGLTRKFEMSHVGGAQAPLALAAVSNEGMVLARSYASRKYRALQWEAGSWPSPAPPGLTPGALNQSKSLLSDRAALHSC